jgi:hypothetical protein|uniref:Uncharacterized protein n=1 Tax=Siphoviridae sp. ctLsx2 TaxID=2826254 RepID=A0A8S5QTA0_9CAUD|nr:MAG TPA: hypothetical protein [Siphoviridae sp. ctLsx2]
MERLTNKREADAQREGYERRLANGYQRSIPVERFLRLAAYEDTGLTPEEIDMDHEAAETLRQLCRGCDLDRLEKLAEADKDGRLVALPCKVGDFVYGFHNGKTILPMVAKWFETNYDGWSVAVQHVPMAPRFYRFSDFGKTAFLTREEAEKALEAMKDGNS